MAVNKVSARTIETAKPKEAPYRITVGKGLTLLINPNGSKWWRFRYRFADKAKMLSLGTYPDVSLKQAEDRRDEARRLVADGIDPSQHKKEQKAATKIAADNTFEAIALEWMERHPPKAAATAQQNRWLLSMAIRAIGNRPIAEIKPAEVLAICRDMEDRGRLHTAHIIKSKCGQVFRYAVATGRAEADPTHPLRGAIKSPERKHMAAITDPVKVGELLRAIDGYTGYMVTQCALKLAPLVFIRPGELRAAKWADIDLEAGLWSYTPPKTRTKTQLDHVIPLATQAIAILRDLHMLTGDGTYLFPSLRGGDSCMSENTTNAALRRMGFTADEMTSHGFRAMARTILDEVLGFRLELIEQQLAHQVRDMNGRAYNRTKHLPERTRMMQAWADYLDSLKSGKPQGGGEVVQVNFSQRA